MTVATTIDAAIVLAAAGLTLLLPRRAAGQPAPVTEELTAEYSAGAAR